MANTVKAIVISVTSIICGGVAVDYVKPVVAKLMGQQSVPPAAVMPQPQPQPVVEPAPADKIAPTSELSPPAPTSAPQTVAPNSEPTLLAEPNVPLRTPAVVAPPAKAEPAPAVAAVPKASPLPVQSRKSATAKPAPPRAKAAPSPAQPGRKTPRADLRPPAPTARDRAERWGSERNLAEDVGRRGDWPGERRGLERRWRPAWEIDPPPPGRLREFRRRPDFPPPGWAPAPHPRREWQGPGRHFNPERFGRWERRRERW